jgi:hypothetical protein
MAVVSVIASEVSPAVVQPASATPVVAVAAVLVVVAILVVLTVSFYFHRRSDRRTPPSS